MKTMDSGLGTQERAERGTPVRRPIHSYHDIEAFQRAMTLLRPIHRLALTLPDYEKYDLASQLRRTSKSIPANVQKATVNGVLRSNFARIWRMPSVRPTS
jgi:hypothetical protein